MAASSSQVGKWIKDLASSEDKTPGGGAASAMCGALASAAAAFAASVSGKSKKAKNKEELKVCCAHITPVHGSGPASGGISVFGSSQN